MQQKNKYPVLKMFTKSFFTITDNWKYFLKSAGFFAAILLVLAFGFQQSFVCLLSTVSLSVPCSSTVLTYFIYLILKLLIISSFLRIWIDKIYLQKQITPSYLGQNIGRLFAFFAFLLLFLAFNCLPLISLYILIIRTPNPVWQIELAFFVFVSLGFILPFVLIRFYANISLWIVGEPFLDFKKTYLKTNFQFSRILLAFTCVLACCLVFFIILQSNLKQYVFTPIYLYDVLAEFLFDLGLLFMACTMLNFIVLQKDYLQSSDETALIKK